MVNFEPKKIAFILLIRHGYKLTIAIHRLPISLVVSSDPVDTNRNIRFNTVMIIARHAASISRNESLFVVRMSV
jgi:hypothetical protein